MMSQPTPCSVSRREAIGTWCATSARRLILARLVFAVAGTLVTHEARSLDRPNVILIMTDDQGFGDLGAHGNRDIQTPHLDRLAAESVRCSQFYVSPVCSPTRSSLLTGRYAYRTGVVDTYLGRSRMFADEQTLAELLGGAGYRTGIFGKWHLGDNYPLRPQDQGFEETLVHRGGGIGQSADPPGNAYRDPWLWQAARLVRRQGFCSEVFTDAAMQFVERHSASPFFLYLAYNCPHVPLEAPIEALRRYPFFADARRVLPEVPLGELSPEETTNRVYALVSDIDQQVGRLLQHVDRLGLRERTIVVFLTDNGPQQSRYNGNLRGLKGTVHEGGIRVPCFARWPAHWPAGRTLDVPAAHIDWVPTLLAACQVALPADRQIDGLDLGPWMADPALAAPDRPLVSQYHRGDVPERYRSCAVRRGRWKLVQARGARQEPLPDDWRFELFDLSADPGETRDLAAEHPEVVLQLTQDYETWFTEMAAARQFSPPAIVVGSDHENPTTLTHQDWRGPHADWSGRGSGHWDLMVDQAGTYEVRLRFAPLAKAVKATCHWGATALIDTVPAGATECTWREVHVAAGPATLAATLAIDGQGEEAAAGPQYVDLWRRN